MQGISGTVFAYGVTSSGKTHTMMGTAADPGVVPRAITALFEEISQATDRCGLQETHAQRKRRLQLHHSGSSAPAGIFQVVLSLSALNYCASFWSWRVMQHEVEHHARQQLHMTVHTTATQQLTPVLCLLLVLLHGLCRVFTVTFSMMEIYCEMLNDLLDPSKLNLDVQVRRQSSP